VIAKIGEIPGIFFAPSVEALLLNVSRGEAHVQAGDVAGLEMVGKSDDEVHLALRRRAG
jgi:hypothetical protein